LPGLGTGYSFGFLAIFVLSNPMVYDAAAALNSGIAQLAGLALSIVAFVLVPTVTGTRWQRRRQLRRLREQVTLAASAPLEGLAYRFESVSRDLFQQVVTHTQPGSAESRNLLAWALAVHESGRAVLELRQDLADGTLPAEARSAAAAALQAVAQLYRHPDPARWLAADRTVRAAMVAAPPGAAARLHLYQLRSALRDDESPLAASMPPPDVADAA